MTVTVTVDATWRLSLIEFNRYTAMVLGRGEVILQETATPSPDAAILRNPVSPFGDLDQPIKTYGAMPGAPIGRVINDVIEETVEVDGTMISFENTMEALTKFFEKWRLEDLAKPLPQKLIPAVLTEMPPPPLGVVPPPPPSLVAAPKK